MIFILLLIVSFCFAGIVKAAIEYGMIETRISLIIKNHYRLLNQRRLAQ